MLKTVKGVAFSVILLLVAYFGGLFFLPPCLLLWLVPFCSSVARRANDYVVTLWFRLVPGLLEVIFGIKVKICGDLKPLASPCIIILNHRTRFDWLFLSCFLMRLGDLAKCKIILKNSLKKIPPFGWAMQATHFLFISRDWSRDEKYLTEHLSYFKTLKYPLQLLIFPEGTDLSDSNKAKSYSYAEKNDLDKYEYVLHPRTTGFIHCVTEMRKFDTPLVIINMSIGYVGGMPQNECDLVFGNWPSEIHFFSEHITPSQVPKEKEQLEGWLKSTWKLKEEQLKHFYSRNKFNAPYMRDSEIVDAHADMKHILGFWVLFFVWISYLMFTSYFYWWYVPLWTLFYLAFTFFSSGTEELVVKRMKLQF